MFKYSHRDKVSKRYCYLLSSEDAFAKILIWAQQYPLFSYFNSNDYYSKNSSEYDYSRYKYLLGFSYNILSDNIITPSQLNNYIITKKDWLLGYLSYDLKNEFHNLDSKNTDNIGFRDMFFFVPDIVIYKEDKAKDIVLASKEKLNLSAFENEINTDSETSSSTVNGNINIQSRFTKDEYIRRVSKIKEHIQKGDIYELNFCQEFYNEQANINPWETYKNLSRLSPTPFSCFLKHQNRFLISSSPERYLKKQGRKIISQPIKGTAVKGKDKAENLRLANGLRDNPKERAENIMIVDLVRNDLSQTAKPATVRVEELCGIYPFNHLYQMISTVTSVLQDNKTSFDLIETSFPMGSMTGAPKVKAMELIDRYENTKRGLYSGSVGYFTPDGDFDFNVVIRSILYNEDNNYLSFTVGSAITIQSDAHLEYSECLLKAKAIIEIL